MYFKTVAILSVSHVVFLKTQNISEVKAIYKVAFFFTPQTNHPPGNHVRCIEFWYSILYIITY